MCRLLNRGGPQCSLGGLNSGFTGVPGICLADITVFWSLEPALTADAPGLRPDALHADDHVTPPLAEPRAGRSAALRADCDGYFRRRFGHAGPSAGEI